MKARTKTIDRDKDSVGRITESPPESAVTASVVDLFCGAGGLSHGFLMEGIPVVGGIDLDENCRYPFERNNRAPFLRRDVTEVSGADIETSFAPGGYRILVGCAPCQPFSRYTQGREGRGIEDPKWSLLREFARLIEESRPDIVSMENVQRLRRFRGGEVLDAFVTKLKEIGYFVSEQDVYCPDYGMAQGRTRLVLLASLHGPIELECPSRTPGTYATVHDAIGHLPPISAGGSDPDDHLHVSAGLSDINETRIRASRPGGTWRDWPENIRLSCHRKDSGRGYASVYGRMEWPQPSPTITTQFYGIGNGRFGHPEQDRALSLREGAILQGFPPEYAFVRDGESPNFTVLGRLIGNAVPVELGRVIARSVLTHLNGLSVV